MKKNLLYLVLIMMSWLLLQAEWSETQKILAAGYEEAFGRSASLHEDQLIVGAPSDGWQGGHAYIFQKVDNAWVEQVELTASYSLRSNKFGSSVSIHGNYALVSDPEDDSFEYNQGAVYLYFNDNGVWTLQEFLHASDLAELDYFGSSVSIYGDIVLIGARADDDNGYSSGSAYIFQRNGDSWTQQVKLTASDGSWLDHFGISVSLFGDYALIGADGDDSGSGSAYVFRREGDAWIEQSKLIASDASENDGFGNAVAIFEDYAIIGAHGDDNYTGSTYIFYRSGDVWNQQAKLTSLDSTVGDGFGKSVAISDDYAFIGSPFDDDNGTYSGSAYIFCNDAGNWDQLLRLVPNEVEEWDCFGYSVTVYNDQAVIGAYGDNENGYGAGAAYAYQNDETCFDDNTIIINENKLIGNRPNPFNPSTTISYQLVEDSPVFLSVFNIRGQQVKQLVNDHQSSGRHSIIWDGTDDFGKPVSSGIYFYELKAKNFVMSRKMILLR